MQAMENPPRNGLRVLFVSTAGRPGGAEVSLSLLVRHLCVQGVDVGVLAPREALRVRYPLGEDVWRLTVRRFEPVRHVAARQAVALAAAGLWNMWLLLDAIRTFRPDIVHANTTGAMLWAAPAAWWRRTPVVWHVRDFASARWLVAWCGRCAAAVIAVSHAVRDGLVRYGVDPRKVTVVYNGVDVFRLSSAERERRRQQLRARMGWPADAFVYLNVGQYAAWKRQDLFLRAAARVARMRSRSRFVLVGGWPCGGDTAWRRYLEELVLDLGLSGRVRILGWEDDLETVLSGADVLVHTARREPFGRVLIEAMAAGLPVIAPRDAGPIEIIEDEVSGCLFRPGDVERLVVSMCELQADPVLRERLAARAKRRVAASLTAEQTARRVRRVYDAVLARPVPGFVAGRAGSHDRGVCFRETPNVPEGGMSCPAP